MVLVDGYNLYYGLIDMLKENICESDEEVIRLMWYDLFRLVEVSFSTNRDRQINLFHCQKRSKKTIRIQRKNERAFVNYHHKKYKERFDKIYGYFQSISPNDSDTKPKKKENKRISI